MVKTDTYRLTASMLGKIPVVRLEGVERFDVSKTFDCGQCFRFEPVAGSQHTAEYAGVAHGRLVSFAQDCDTLYIYNSTERDFYGLWRRYLGLDVDYAAIDADILSRSDNPALREAVHVGSGIRILRQPEWETVCSFIISQNNNIPRIKKIISAMSERYGERISAPGMESHGGAAAGAGGAGSASGGANVANGGANVANGMSGASGGADGANGMSGASGGADGANGMSGASGGANGANGMSGASGGANGANGMSGASGALYSFPTPESLCEAGVDGLFALRTGFRAKYIYDAARVWSGGGIDVAALPTADAARVLEGIKGVGPKVAACSLLFGFGRLDAFPVDVWIKRVIARYFGEGFTAESLGPYAGVAQQYVFYYERYLGGDGRL